MGTYRVSTKDERRYVTVLKVVPSGPQSVLITVEVFGDGKSEAGMSALIIEDEEFEPNDVDARDECHNKFTLSYENVLLLKPLCFRYGSKTENYSSLSISLDEDSWAK